MNTDRVLPSPALRHTSRWLVSVGFLLALATQVLAGGEIVTTVQNGNWADFETWDLHIPSSENGDQAVVVHEVDVTEESPETGGLAVGAAAGPGLIDITGSLAVFDGAQIGTGANSGTVNAAGGEFYVGFDLSVGAQSYGELNVTSGLVSVGTFGGDLRVGTDGFPGLVAVEGADATFTVNGSVRFGANSTLRVTPTGNGPSGLTTIESTGTQYIDAASSTLELDFSLYEPSVGDSWEIVRFAPESSVDKFANVVTPHYVTVEQVNETAESITIRVTEVRILANATDGLFEDGVRITWSQPSGLEFINRVYRIDPAIQDTLLLSKVAATDTLYFDTTGLPDKVYTYCVERENVFDPGAPTESFCDEGFRRIFAPVQVKASDGTYSDQVRVTWVDRSTIEAGFAIYRGAPGELDPPLLDMVEANVQLYEDTSAEPGVDYDYEVRAFDDASFESAGNRDAGVRGRILPPANVAASDGLYADKVVVTWDDVTEEEDGFRVYRDDVLLVELGPNETSYEDLTQLGTPHEYAVVSTLLEILGDDTITWESTRVSDFGIGGPQSLVAPTDVSASDGTFDDRVRITWTDVVPNESGFEIRRDDVLIGEVGANATSFDDLDLAPGIAASYCVTAVVESGGGSEPVCDSGTRAYVVPVTNVQATDGEFETFVRLTWESESTTAVLFKILQNGFVRKTVSADYRTCDIGHEVPTGQESEFCVVAVTALGQEAASDCDYGFRTLLPPSDIAATDDAFEDRTLVTWSDNSASEGGYRILRDSVENPSGPVEIGQVPANREAYIDGRGATAGETFTYYVAAMDVVDSSPGFDSETDSDVGSRKINAPTDAAASQGDYENRIVVTWKDNSFAESSYDVYRDDVLVGSVPANSTEYEDANVDFGATHQYAIRATDAGGASDPATTSGFTTIQAPGSVRASDDYESYVSLVWTDESVVESGYLITRDGVEITTTAPNQTVYTDNTAPAGQEVEYCVYAVRGGQQSEPGCDFGMNYVATDEFDASTDRIKARTPTSVNFGGDVAVDGGWALIGASAILNPSAHMFKRS
ncbi:MAG: hypothetical protein KDA27_24645, partial [Candidatus Eisenbacteria bacterium]|nr:hypothetical protein [Candidatus Eisenbacteria bacterium]